MERPGGAARPINREMMVLCRDCLCLSAKVVSEDAQDMAKIGGVGIRKEGE